MRVPVPLTASVPLPIPCDPGGRFLKTYLTRHEEGQGGLVVVKVYLKRGAPGAGGGLNPDVVARHERRLREIRDALLHPPPAHPHAWPFQRELETERAVFLMRQYAHSTLYDRISTRPFLQHVQKRWICYQLLHGLSDAHARGVTHGDLKTENVLMTSWGWAFIADFASFKPPTLPADNPADYSYFFDTGGRRRCYVAPERFRDVDNNGGPSAQDANHDTVDSMNAMSGVTESADVFSLGCVLGELFLDGAALFDLSQLLAFRRGTHNPTSQLNQVDDVHARELILSMTNRDPSSRLGANEYLGEWTKRGWFPAYFDELHDLCAGLATRGADGTAFDVQRAFPELMDAIVREEWEGAEGAEGGGADTAVHEVKGGVGGSSAGGASGSAGSTRVLETSGNFWTEDDDDDERNRSRSDPPNVTGLASSGTMDQSVFFTPPTHPSSEPKEFQSKRLSGPPASRGVVAEVAWETVRENQLREHPGAPWRPAHGDGLDGERGRPSDADASCPPPGWRWDGDWADGGSGWSHFDSGRWVRDTDARDATWRRRTWRRKRVKMSGVDALHVGAEGVPSMTTSEASREAVKEPSSLLQAAAAAGARCPGAALVATVVCSCVRGAVRPGARRDSLTLLARCASVADDDARLQLVVPFCVAMAGDASAVVRAAAVAALAQTLPAIETFPASDAKVFPEFIWPALAALARDREESVRVAYASALATLATTSARFLQKTFAAELSLQKFPEVSTASVDSHDGELTAYAQTQTAMSAGEYDADLAAIRAIVRGVAMDYLTPDGAPPALAGGGGGLGGLATVSRQSSLTPGGTFGFASPASTVAAGAVPEPREEGAEGADAAVEKPRAARPGLSVQRPTFFTRAGVASPAPATTVSPTRTAGRAETVPGAQGVGPATRAALLSGADELARFFGRADSNDFFVPLLITCLNDRAWPLRASFFEHIADVGKFVGRAPCEAFLLPCVERCLSDSSDEVVAWALKCLGDMVGAPSSDSSRSHPEKENQPAPPFEANQHIEGNGSVLQKRSVVAAAQRAAPALCHPAGAIRKSARRFFSAAARFLGRADTFALLLPAVRPFMRDGLSAGLSGSVCAAVDVIGDEDALRAALRPPPSRAAFDAAVASAAGLGNYPHQDGTPMESTPDKAKDLRDRWRSTTTSTHEETAGETALGTDSVSDESDTETREDEDVVNSSEEEAAVLAALEPYLRTLAAGLAFRAASGDTSVLTGRSIVTGGLTPDAAAWRLASTEASVGGSSSSSPGLYSPNPRLVPRSRVEQEGSLNPLEGMLSPFARAPSGPIRTSGVGNSGQGGTSVTSNGLTPGTNGGGDSGLYSTGHAMTSLQAAHARGDRDAWAATFGMRSPLLVPPGAALVHPPNGHPFAGGTHPGPDQSGLLRGHQFVDQSGQPAAAARSPFDKAPFGGGVTDALTQAMAKGLDLAERSGTETSDKAPVRGPAASPLAAAAAARSPTPPANGREGSVADPGSFATGAPGDRWAPRGVLVAHLQEHRGPVRALASSTDGLFVVSGGDDGQCKLWDCTRLERDVSFRSRLTYASQGGRVTALVSLDDGGGDHAVASASDNGSVHAWRVEYVERGGPSGGSNSRGESTSTDRDGRSSRRYRAPPSVERYTGAAEIATVSRGSGAVTAMIRTGVKTLCYSTARGGVRGWDLRSKNSEAFRVNWDSQLGTISALVAEHGGGSGTHENTSSPYTPCFDPRWLVAGTSRGCLALMDLRFGARVAEWRHPTRAPIDALVLATEPSAHGTDARPMVWCAAGRDEVASWDVAAGTCGRVLRVTRGSSSHDFENDGALKNGGRLDVFELDSRRHDGDDSYLSTNELGDGAARDDGVRCLLPLPSGALLSGGSDACVRMWCPGEPGRSKVVSGPLPPGPRPTYDESRDGVNGTPVLREVPTRDERGGNTGGVNVGDQVAAAAVRHDCHRDSVLCMAAVGTGMQRMLVTCGRDAAVKVWK